MTTTTRLAPWPAALLCAGAVFAPPVVAQDVKPGLWEINTRMQHSDKAMQDAMAKMQQQMASTSPAQRKQMESMMGGMGMSVDGKGGMRIKSCVTPEDAARMKVPVQEGDCTTSPPQRSGNATTFSYQCTNPASKGEATVTLLSPTAYTMKNKTQVTQKGKTSTIEMEAEGRWLGDDCTGALNAPQKNKKR